MSFWIRLWFYYRMVYGFVFFSLCQHANNDPVAESLYCNILRFFSSVFFLFSVFIFVFDDDPFTKKFIPFFYRQKTIHMYTYLHRKHGDSFFFIDFCFIYSFCCCSRWISFESWISDTLLIVIFYAYNLICFSFHLMQYGDNHQLINIIGHPPSGMCSFIHATSSIFEFFLLLLINMEEIEDEGWRIEGCSQNRWDEMMKMILINFCCCEMVQCIVTVYQYHWDLFPGAGWHSKCKHSMRTNSTQIDASMCV